MGRRDDLSCTITLPFPHLFQGRKESERDRDKQTDESRGRKGETARGKNDTPLRFLHN